MKLLQSLPFSNNLWHACENTDIYALNHSSGVYTLFSFNEEASFLKKNSFTYNPNIYSNPCFDDDSIYLPSSDGQILVMDKFNLTEIQSFDLGYLSPISDLFCDDKYVYCLGGTVLNGVTKTIDTVAVLVIDKNTGKKVFQSMSFEGELSGITVFNKKIYLCNKKELIVISEDLESTHRTKLNFHANYVPVINDKYICMCSSSGSLEIFDHDLNIQGRMLLNSNMNKPSLVGDDLYWLTSSGIFKVNIPTKKAVTLDKSEYYVRSDMIVHNEDVLAVTEKGEVIKIEKGKDIDILKISENYCRLPSMSNNYLFVSSRNELHQICLNS